MAKNKQKRRHAGRPVGMTFADELARKRMIRQAAEEAAKDATLRFRSDKAIQRALWLTTISVADAYGFGATRMQPFFEALEANSEELERMRTEVDEDYAYEKLRLKAERVTGQKIKYLYEHEELAEQVREAGDEVNERPTID